MKRIAVKIGSNVLTRKDGTLDITRMSALVDQVADLHRQGMEIVLISSGAVASGRSEIKAGKKLDPVSARQLYSAVGQAKLINRYYELFREHGMTCGQVLTTKENFGSRTHYLNQKHCMEVMLENKVIPIVNENDTISVTELMFTDNDELSGLIATMMGMVALVILSNIDGIYNGNPSDPDSSVIREIECGKTDLSEYVQTSKSSFGRGGMLTKCHIAQKVADEGIAVIIANGKNEKILRKLLGRPLLLDGVGLLNDLFHKSSGIQRARLPVRPVGFQSVEHLVHELQILSQQLELLGGQLLVVGAEKDRQPVEIVGQQLHFAGDLFAVRLDVGDIVAQRVEQRQRLLA